MEDETFYQCCEDMTCVECGAELDADNDCDCMCHQLV